MRPWPLALVVLVALPLTGCGGNNAETSTAPPGLDSEAAHPAEDIERAGPLAGTLRLDQRVVSPEQTISFRVVNRGRVEMVYGAGEDVERYERPRWVNVNDEIYPRKPGIPAIAITTKPGETSMRRFSWLKLPMDLRSGHYRITRVVGDDTARPANRLRLDGEFEVR
jgi:hypothetical protein